MQIIKIRSFIHAKTEQHKFKSFSLLSLWNILNQLSIHIFLMYKNKITLKTITQIKVCVLKECFT